MLFIMISSALFVYVCLQYSLFLRDLIDHLATRKVREVTDFEWRRYLRFYVQDIGICFSIFLLLQCDTFTLDTLFIVSIKN